jgi:hypothetical protein
MLQALTLVAAAETFTLTDRTESRVRNPDPATNAAAVDLSTQPDARLVLDVRRDRYTLAYDPSITLLDINGIGFRPALMNGALLGAEWNWPRLRLSLTESAAYGQQTFASLSVLSAPGAAAAPGATPGQPQPIPAAQPVPVAQTFTYASSDTELASTFRIPRWEYLLSTGFRLSGGADDASRKVVPFQHGIIGGAQADYRLTGRDHVISSLGFQQSTFSTGPEDVIVSLEEGWRHRWARTTDTRLAAGVYEARTRITSNGPTQYATNPTGEAEVHQRVGRGNSTFDLRADARLAPIVNVLVGQVDQRVQGTLEVDWTLRSLTLRAVGTAAESTAQQTPIANRMILGELDASYRLSPALSLDAGAREVAQKQNVPTVTGSSTFTQVNFSQTVVFVAVTVRAVNARF